MDIWVEGTPDNYVLLKKAFAEFGMPVFDMTEDNFLNHKNWDVFTFGMPPSAIDVMINVKGLNFPECYEKAIFFLEEDLKIRTIHISDLITAKKSSARPKDLDDLENLS